MDYRTLLKALVLMALLFLGAWVGLKQTLKKPPIEKPLPPEVRVQVLDSAGRVPTDCAGTLSLRVDDTSRRIDKDSTLRCGPQGHMAWTDLTPGIWRLAVAGEGTVLREEDIEVGAPVDLGVWTLGPGGNVAGTITLDGEPHIGAQIRTRSGHTGISTAQGRYVLRGVPTGPVEVFAGWEDHGASGVIDVSVDEVAELDLELVPVDAKGVIGIQFEATDEGLSVTAVHPGGPARSLQIGQLVTTIDGTDTRDLSQLEAKEALAGAPGTSVELVVDGQALSLVRVDLKSLP